MKDTLKKTARLRQNGSMSQGQNILRVKKFLWNKRATRYLIGLYNFKSGVVTDDVSRMCPEGGLF